jgi:hypothetical protein
MKKCHFSRFICSSSPSIVYLKYADVGGNNAFYLFLWMVGYLPRADQSAVSAINRLLRCMEDPHRQACMEDPHRQVCTEDPIVGRVWIVLLKGHYS